MRWSVVLLVVVGSLIMSGSPAGASPIYWQIDGLVHGTVATPSPPSFPPTPDTLVSVPIGTPMVIDLAFDSATPDACGINTPGGIYPIGFSSGNSATMHFLGYDYAMLGGIEVGVLNCGGPGLGTLIRLGTSSAVQTDPNGILVNWLFSLAGGGLLINGPPPPALGQLPVALPTDPFPTGVLVGSSNFGVKLTVDFAEIRTVPEPGTFGLLAFGMAALRWTRKSRK